MKSLMLDRYTKHVEKTLFLTICSHLEGQTLDRETAQRLAQQFLTLLPAENQESFLFGIYTLGKHYAEACALYARFGGNYEEEKRQYLLSHMRASLTEHNIDQALTYSKGGDYHGIN